MLKKLQIVNKTFQMKNSFFRLSYCAFQTNFYLIMKSPLQVIVYHLISGINLNYILRQTYNKGKKNIDFTQNCLGFQCAYTNKHCINQFEKKYYEKLFFQYIFNRLVNVLKI